MNPIVELIVVFGGTLSLSVPFGLYIARMISYELRPLEAPLAKSRKWILQVNWDR